MNKKELRQFRSTDHINEMSSTEQTENTKFNATELAEKSSQKANELKEQRRAEFEAHRKQRDEKLSALIDQDLRDLQAKFEDPLTSEAIEEAINRGHDSIALRGTEYYLPVFTSEGEGEEKKRVLISPREQTYITAPDEENGVPYATIRRGIYNRKSRTSNPTRLPGGKTSVQLFSDYLNDHGGLFVVQRAMRKNGQSYTILDIVWDMESYEARQKRFNERRRKWRQNNRKKNDS